jgi:hypothetical protein
MAILEDSGPYASPNDKPDFAGGKPALQAMSEAQNRCEARRKWQKDHPGEFSSGIDDWEQRSRDYDAIENGQSLLGCCGARTFEPGDAFVSNKEK